MLPFLAISPTLREAFANRRSTTGGNGGGGSEVLNKFYAELRAHFTAGLAWLQGSGPVLITLKSSSQQPKSTKPDPIYVTAFYRLLYLDKAEVYANVDGYPGDAERGLFMKMGRLMVTYRNLFIRGHVVLFFDPSIFKISKILEIHNFVQKFFGDSGKVSLILARRALSKNE